MRYFSLRRSNYSVSPGVFPVGGTSRWEKDYSVGFSRSEGVTHRVGGYFFRNPGWKRTRFLFSHLRVTWELSWVVRVFWIGRFRTRRVRTRWARWLKRKLRRRRRHSACKLTTRRVRRVRLPYRTRRGRGPRFTPRRRRGGLRVPYRTRRVNRWNRLALVRQTRRATPWKEMAGVWSTSQVRWIWCRIPHLRWGTLASLMAHLKYRLQGRFERRLRGVALPLLGLTRRLPGVQGAQVRCSGRFTRAPRGKTQTFGWGKLQRGNPAVRLEQAFLTRALRFGAIGVTLLVSYAGA